MCLARKRSLLNAVTVGILMLGLVLGACAGPATEAPAEPTEAPAEPTEAPAEEPTEEPAEEPTEEPSMASENEAPMLRELVDAGELPPLEERLPAEPMIVEPVEGMGEYGGTLHSAIRGAAEESSLRTSVWYDHLVRWNRETNQVVPNLAKSWAVSDDATEYTFHLREGVKWSDGTPLTSDHFVFTVDDVMMNENLAPPLEILTGSGDWGIEKVDDYAFTLWFEEPNGFLLRMLASVEADMLIQYPFHYMRQYHIDYNPDANALAEEEGYADWIAMFEAKSDLMGDNPELPVLCAWRPVTPLGAANTTFVMERNPYYWKVDPEGRQLPYIDRVSYLIYDQIEPIVLKALSGDIDFMDRRINTLPNKALFAEARESGDFHFVDLKDTKSNWTLLSFNLTVQNERLREIFREKDFRIAMSHAINRQDIIDVLYVGQGEPWQSSPRKGSGFYNEQLAKQYTEYDPEKAKELLEGIGLVDKDGDGWREWPDSQDEDFTFTMITRSDKVWMNDTMELVIPMWHEVGVNAFNKTVEKSFQRQLRNSNDYDAIIDDGDGGWTDILWDPRTVLPVDNDSTWGEAWYNYLHEPDKYGEEPIEYFQVGLEMWQEAQTTGDLAEQERLMAEIVQRAADYFINLGIALPAQGYAIAKNDLKNLPESYLKGWNFCTPGALDMCQWYFEGGARE